MNATKVNSTKIATTKVEKNDYSAIMDLEKLQKQYSVLLLQYKQSVIEYTNHLQSNNENNNDNNNNNTNNNNNNDNKTMVSIPNAAYLGKGSAGETDVTTLQDCEAVCSSTKNCSGATFISGKCNIRTGDSTILPSDGESYAIVPKSKQLLMRMEGLNKQLLELNTKISQKIKHSQPIYTDLKKEQYKQNIELMKRYKQLEEERENILKLLDDYSTLSTSENANQIRSNQQYYIYLLLVVLAIAIAGLLIYLTNSNPKPKSNAYSNSKSSFTYSNNS